MRKFDLLFEKELSSLKLFSEKLCDDARNKELQDLLVSGQDLPAGCRKSDEKEGVFFEQVDREGMTKEEIFSLLQLRQAKDIRTIKNCALFFVAITAISLLLSIIGAVA